MSWPHIEHLSAKQCKKIGTTLRKRFASMTAEERKLGPRTEETKKRGPHTEEIKRKISIARKKWWASLTAEEKTLTEEFKETLSIAQKKRWASISKKEKRITTTKGVRMMHLGNASKFHRSLIPILISTGYTLEHPIGKYLVDFAHLESKTIIEIDGPGHLSPNQIKEDKKRDRYTKSKGWRTIRVHE